MKVLITICARGGSKGIPGKNIKPINGKPLIGYSIDSAKKFQQLYPDTEIALSTDSEEIIEVARQCGLDSDYHRPSYLANDTAGKVDAIFDVVKFYEQKKQCTYDYVLDMDCTSPLLTIDDLTEAYQMIVADPEAITLFSVSPPVRSPYFNQVEKKENGYYDLVKRPTTGSVFTRQSAPQVYDMNASFYFYKRDFFTRGFNDVNTDHSLVYVMKHACFDLDEPLDFEILSYLMENNKLKLSL